MDISLDIESPGWLHASLSDSGASVELRASFLSDAVTDLVSAIAALLEGSLESRTVWQEEPGEYHWNFTRQGREIEVQVHWFDSYPRRFSGQGRRVFSASNDILRFARMVRQQLELLDTPDYPDIWGYPYPREWVDRLGKAIRMNTGHIDKK